MGGVKFLIFISIQSISWEEVKRGNRKKLLTSCLFIYFYFLTPKSASSVSRVLIPSMRVTVFIPCTSRLEGRLGKKYILRRFLLLTSAKSTSSTVHTRPLSFLWSLIAYNHPHSVLKVNESTWKGRTAGKKNILPMFLLIAPIFSSTPTHFQLEPHIFFQSFLIISSFASAPSRRLPAFPPASCLDFATPDYPK